MFKTAISSVMRGQYLTTMFAKLVVIFTPTFIGVISRTSTQLMAYPPGCGIMKQNEENPYEFKMVGQSTLIILFMLIIMPFLICLVSQ